VIAHKMTSLNNAIEAGGEMPPAPVKVWDPFVRVFHWSLVALFAAAFATGDESDRLHIAIGYATAGLIGLRILWGFGGTRHARFSDFVRGPREIISYLRDLVLFRAPRYLGHNPAGGAMIIALLVMLTGTCISGYLLTTDAYWGSKRAEEIHEVFANLTVGLIAFHVLGVLAASLEHRENLVKAMITGRKRNRRDPAFFKAQPFDAETARGSTRSPLID
jgi:cytochrome b